MTDFQQHDVTGRVDVTDPDAVCAEVMGILRARHPGADPAPVERLFADFGRLYRGHYPGFFACDTDYHDMRHVLDVTLAAARLMDGHDASCAAAEQLGAELTVVGLAVALFHDSGYIRRRGDSRHYHGAEYTRIHVSRSARFLADYLPRVGLQGAAALAAKLVHFTGYEFDPDTIELADPKHRTLGALIGTADVMAQMADPDYLRKCRDHLYHEFELGGLTRHVDIDGRLRVRYASPIDLLRQTPDFMRAALEERLDRLFGSLYRYAGIHFGGRNHYVEAIEHNRRYLDELLADDDVRRLEIDNLRPRATRRCQGSAG